MRDEARIDLETQLEKARAAWEQSEQAGAQLAEHALQSDEELKNLKGLFQQVVTQSKEDALRILTLERRIAFLLGIFIYLMTCAADGEGLFVRFPDLKLPGYLMCSAPFLYLYLRKSWRKFQIKHDWNSWLDNEFANDIWQFWNQRRNGQ